MLSSKSRYITDMIHSNPNASSTVDLVSLSRFIATHTLSHLFISDTYNITGLVTSAVVYPIARTIYLRNGPHVVSMSPYKTGLSVTPVYRLHEDVWESFMSAAIPNKDIAGSYITMQVSIPGTRMPAIIIPSRLR